MTDDGTFDASFEGYALPHGRYRARRSRGPRYFLTLGVWVIALVVAMMILTLIDTKVVDTPVRYVCPPDCGRPPTGLPVATNPRFTAPNASFPVSYPAPGAAYGVTFTTHRCSWKSRFSASFRTQRVGSHTLTRTSWVPSGSSRGRSLT